MPYTMRAKFGLSLSTRAVLFDWGSLDDLIEAAQSAEASGYFDGVWIGDNLLSKPRVEAIVTLAALAARTRSSGGLEVDAPHRPRPREATCPSSRAVPPRRPP